MKKKYELTNEIMCFDGVTLHRIKALKNFGDVKAGELGGWVESENNLSQYGNCWIDIEAKAYKNAEIKDDAVITRHAVISDNATIYGNAYISGETVIGGFAYIYNDTEIFGNSVIDGEAILYGKVRVFDAKITDAKIRDNVVIDSSSVQGRVTLEGKAYISKGAIVHKMDDFIVFKNFWSSGRYFTWTRSNNKWSVGCFHGTGEELIKKAYQDSKKSGREYERVVRYVESILADENKTQYIL